MKKLQLLLALLISSVTSFAQVQVCLGTDATVCQGQTVTITNCGSGGGGGGITMTNPSTVNLGDDNFSPMINMGFSFSYYGNTYNQLTIGANGIVSFNTANAGNYCAWALDGTNLPSTTAVPTAKNSPMGCYQDLNPANGNSGPVLYQTVGTAPNRQFVVLYNGVTMFSCTNSCSYIGFVFYEGSNIIEYFIGDKGACSGWNSNRAIQGTENSAGTIAHITPGRNNTVWVASQDGRRWTPTSSTNTNNYTITQIPYLAINAPGGAMQWQNTLNQTFPYNNGVLNVSPVPPGVTGYFLTGTSCSGTPLGAISDTTFITRSNIAATVAATTDFCSSGQGTATATPTNASLSGGPFTYAWTPSGQTTQTATGLVAGPHQVTVTNAAGCTVTLTVTVPNTPVVFSATSTVVSCPGGADGTATATMTPSAGTLTYLWDDPAAQTTQTATGLAAGTYNCTITSSNGCTGVATVTVTEIPGMVATIGTPTNDPSCNSGSDGQITVDVNDGTSPYSYVWDNSSSTSSSANDLSAGTHTVTITDANGCVITISETLGEPAPLAITSLSPDAIICPEATAALSVEGTGGSSDYIFTWTENGTVIGTGPNLIVDPSTDITTYCVTMSETCGSPTTDSCLTLTFPEEIVPLFLSDRPADCAPAEFQITNESNNGEEISSVLLDFGDGQQAMLIGAQDTSHIYVDAGTYDLTATVTSVHGCVTTATMSPFISAIAIPNADFNFSSNPTTIFETSVTMQDKSTASVISWEWSSPSSTPSASTSQNPTFTFPEGVVATYPVQLIVKTPEGCVDTVTRILNVISDILFFAPNAFTPDGDEFNQTWKFSVIGIDEYNFELTIFNRWGEIIWETKDVNAAWDGTYHGKIVPKGAYTWRAKVKAIETDKKEEFSGAITIL